MLSEILLLTASYYFGSEAADIYVKYSETDNPYKARELYSKLKKMENLRDVFLYASLGVYLFNVFDAWFTGRKIQKKFYGLNISIEEEKLCFYFKIYK